MRPPHGGCDFLVDPEIEAPAAPVFWLPGDAPAAVSLFAPLPDVGIAATTLAAIPVVRREEDECVAWLRLESGAQLVGKANAGAAPLGVLLPLDETWPTRLAAAERLRRELAALPVEPPLTRQRCDRLKRALRCVDGMTTGASYRDVATVIFGARRLRADPWKTSSLKAQVVRLAAYGRKMVEGGYRDLLRGPGR